MNLLASPVYKRTLTIYGIHSGVSSADFDRTREAYSCFGYATNRPEVFSDIDSIWELSVNQEGVTRPPSEMVLNGKALSLPRPNHPVAAREHRVMGSVVVKVTIDEKGKVIDAKDMCGGPPYLSESSVKAAYNARFTSTKLSGMPDKVTAVIVYNFVSR